MKQSSENALHRLSAFTNAICATCKPTPHSCCAPIFCEAVAVGLEAAGRPVPPRGGHPTMRFMGPSGCIIPPELRPGCTGFVCQERVQDRKIRREYDRLQEKAFADPDVRCMLDPAAEFVTKGLGL